MILPTCVHVFIQACILFYMYILFFTYRMLENVKKILLHVTEVIVFETVLRDACLTVYCDEKF